MSIQQHEIRLVEYLDGALSDDERREFEGHLATCAECRSAVAQMRQVEATMNAVRPVAGPDFQARVMQAIRRLPCEPAGEADPTRSRSPWSDWVKNPLWLGSVLALALIVAAGLTISLLSSGPLGGPPLPRITPDPGGQTYAGASGQSPAVEHPAVIDASGTVVWPAEAARDTLYRTSSTARLEVALFDRSRLIVRPDSRVRMRADGVVLESGAVWATFEKLPPGKIFTVFAGETEVRVVGTTFGVRRAAGDDGLEVVLLEGLLEVQLASMTSFVHAGEVAWVEEGLVRTAGLTADRLKVWVEELRPADRARWFPAPLPVPASATMVPEVSPAPSVGTDTQPPATGGEAQSPLSTLLQHTPAGP
jgi:ferric-dicitrate binding protein FerR (iron transport regulator)